MITINDNKLRDLISGYKIYFPKKIEVEIYKWKAVKKFQDTWNIDAPNFWDMFNNATSLHDNLLMSRNHFPKGVIRDFYKYEPEATRNMFRNLFDESKALDERINAFISEANRIQKAYMPNDNHYQDLNAISTYLWSMFPDKYYIYKFSELTATAEIVESSYQFKRGAGVEGYKKAIEFFNIMRTVLQQDDDLRRMLDKVLTDDCYKDEGLTCLATDLHYYASRYYNKQDIPPHKDAVQYWMYAPGENAKMWDDCLKNETMCLGWDKIGDYNKYDSLDQIKKQMKIVYGDNSSYVNGGLATWQFAHDLKVGDIVFAKKGLTRIIGRGVVKSDYWYDDSRKEYKHLRKVEWTNIGDWETEGQQAMKTLTNITNYHDYVDKLNRLIDGMEAAKKRKEASTEAGDKQYWWLVANPKIWSLSGMNIGEEQDYTLYNENGHPRRIQQNFLNAKAGDIVIGYESTPTKQIVGLLEIPRAADEKSLYFQMIEKLPSPIDYSTLKSTPGLEDMEYMKNQQGSFFKVTPDEYDIIIDLIRSDNPLPKEEAKVVYDRSQFLGEVYVSYDNYEQLENLLLRKKNLILQGAPGVGKTFAARRLAYAIMGEKDDSRVMQVQFHQNYSYEDFVMGYKPNEEGGFELKNGIFYRFCKRAAADREHKYFFIIDEINRGNLSKIFGELLMLIEDDYRDKPIQLSYKDEQFAVPENLYLIGMMNTADRSLAMIDYALRRRFSFFEMKPGFENPAFKAYCSKLSDPQLNKLVNAIIELNKVIENDDSLGSGFCIGHSYLCNLKGSYNLSNIVEYDIIPMLREYWFDNNDRFNQEAQKLRDSLK